MWQFRSKQTARDLELLKIFYIYQESLTVHQLAERLHCDVKTIRTRILTINNTYNLPKINYDYETDSVSASYDPAFWPFKIYKEFYQQNLEFQVLEYIFIHQHVTTYKLLDTFAISDSTLLRIINNLNQNLEKWDFKISSKNYQIIGDELAITKFFTQYFTEKTATDFFEDFPLFQKAIFNIFIDVLDGLDQYELRAYFMRFQWYTFVSLIRNSQGHTITKENNYDAQLIKERIAMLNPQDLREIESLFGLSLENETVVYDVFYFYFNRFEMLKFNKYRYEYEAVLALTQQINGVFSLNYTQAVEAKAATLLYENMNQYFAQSYFLFNRPLYELERMKLLFPKSIQQLQEMIESFIVSNTALNIEALVVYLVLFIIKTFPDFYDKMGDFEEKLEVNCLFVTQEAGVTRTMKFLEDNYAFMARFKLHENDALPNDALLEDALWIVDIQALSSENTLVINTNLLPLQAALIFDFLSLKRTKR
ncbi:MAG TPA: helix-turn-helix domain-containing protein [Erysipelothrix sp.]